MRRTSAGGRRVGTREAEDRRNKPVRRGRPRSHSRGRHWLTTQQRNDPARKSLGVVDAQRVHVGEKATDPPSLYELRRVKSSQAPSRRNSPVSRAQAEAEG